jgi:hypothetical protein
MFRIFLAGWSVLLVAIVVNTVAAWLGIATWYSYLRSVSHDGFVRASREAGWSWLFLYVVYPVVLGLAASLVL